MATKRLYDLAVKTGSYQDNQGNNKNRYQNIGTVMEGDNGKFILLDPLINLAAVPREAGKDRIMVSMFEPREDGQRQAAPQRQQQAAPVDDIPF
jgi:hypothetical protein